MTDLPVNIDAVYQNRSPGDAAHQQHHDRVHATVNDVDNAYDVAVADGYTGTRQAWLEQIQANANATYRVDTLEAFADRVNGRAFDVTDPTYGATGDGVTDDSAAIQAAIDAAEAANGGVVVFPPGRYLCGTGLTIIGTQPVALVGLGGKMVNETAANARGAVLVTGTAAMTLLTIGTTGTVQHLGARLDDLNLLDGAGGSTLVHVVSTNHWRLSEVSLRDAAVGLSIDTEYGTLGTAGDASWGYVENCRIENCTLGIDAPYGGGFVMTGGRVWHCDNGINFGRRGQLRIIGVKFDFDSAGYGLYTSGAFGVIVGCMFEMFGAGTGLELDADGAFPSGISGEGNQVLGCSFTGHGAGDTGVSIAAGVENTTVLASFNAVGTPVSDLGDDTTLLAAGLPLTLNSGAVSAPSLVLKKQGTQVAEIRTTGTNTTRYDHSAGGASSKVRFRLGGATSTTDFVVETDAGAALLSVLGNGLVRIAGSLDHDGTLLGLFGTTPVSKKTISGSRGGNAALADLLTQLAAYGLITDSTTA